MRNLLTVCAALVVGLGIVSSNLWLELRSARQQIGDLQDQLSQASISVARPGQVQPPPPTVQAPPAPSVAVQLPELRPLPPAAATPVPLPAPPPAPRPVIVYVPAPAPERPLGLPTLTAPLAGKNDQERRAEALAQSDRTAAARVASWSTVLNLTPEQRNALDAITVEELRRETEDSLRISGTAGPMDPVSAARLKVETVNRQYETLTRIADKATPQLNQEQSTRIRNMFASWLTTNMGRARAEEQAAVSGR
jgi:hypothetical protein